MLRLIIESNELDNTWKTKVFFTEELLQIADIAQYHVLLMLKYAERYNTVN